MLRGWFRLAAQLGDPEADMALSKWFLCGSEGAFDKDEALAVKHAEKVCCYLIVPSPWCLWCRRKREFAMGYYSEVGIGIPKDIDVAKDWYTNRMSSSYWLNLRIPLILIRQSHMAHPTRNPASPPSPSPLHKPSPETNTNVPQTSRSSVVIPWRAKPV